MNKKRKILTMVALVAFGVIIALHYCVLGGNNFIFFSTRHYPIIRDVRMPLFVLAVFYAGLFFLFGGKDAEPVPRRPRNWRRIIGLILALLLVTGGVAGIIYSHEEQRRTQEEERRSEQSRRDAIEKEDSKHRITSSEIDLIDLHLGAGYITGRIRNRSSHNCTLNSITLIATLRDKGSPDILGEQTVQIRVEVPPHQTRAISQSIYFPNLPQLTQTWWTYAITEIRGSKGDWFAMNAPAVSPTPSPTGKRKKIDFSIVPDASPTP